MANHEMPRRGSAAAVGLGRLHGMGGIARVESWRTLMAWRGTEAQFDRNIVEPLFRAGLLRLEGGICELTPAGRVYLGVAPVVVPDARATPVAPPYRPDWRNMPRGINRQRPTDLARPGSFDYRDIPSRIGSERLAFKSSIVIEVEAGLATQGSGQR